MKRIEIISMPAIYLILLLLSMGLASCNSGSEQSEPTSEPTTEPASEDTSVEKWDLAKLKTMLSNQSDTIYVLNFWATWCVPCVKEIPFFEAIEKKYASNKLKVVFISLDNSANLESGVIPFVEEKGIQSEVVLLAEDSPHEYIDVVHEDWTGAIPATLVVKGNENIYQFHEGSFTEEELDDFVKPYIN